MRKYITTEALVLTRRTLPSGKKQIVLFTASGGKLIVTAYGSTTLTSHKIGHLEPGNLLFVSLYQNDDHLSLTQSRLIYAYSTIRGSAGSLSQMLQICYLLSNLLPEGVVEESIFQSTLTALKLLNNQSKNVTSFLYQTLEDLGYSDIDRSYDLSSRVSSILLRPYPDFLG